MKALEDVNLFSYLIESGREFNPEILQLTEYLSDENPVQFDEFQAYEDSL